MSAAVQYRDELDRAAHMFERVFQHVVATGCWNLASHDSVEERRVGAVCLDCSIWFNAPIPGPGRYTHWPRDLTHPTSATARTEYLAEIVARALAVRDARQKTAWSRILNGILE